MRRVDQPALVRRFRPGNSSGIAEIHRYALAVSQNAHDAVHAVSSEVVATPLEALVVFIAVIFNSSQMGLSDHGCSASARFLGSEDTKRRKQAK